MMILRSYLDINVDRGAKLSYLNPLEDSLEPVYM